MKELFVIKESNTFSDTLEVLGLAYLIDTVFQKVAPNEKPDILIEDKNYYYQISLTKDLDQSIIDECRYFEFFKYIASKSDDESLSKYQGSIDYQKEKAIRDKYYQLEEKKREGTEQKPHYHYDIIRMCANKRMNSAYNKSFVNCQLFENNFSLLLKIMFEFYLSLNLDRNSFIKQTNKKLEAEGIKIQNINSLQDINPDKGKGVNQAKANGIKPKGQNNFWLQQLIRLTGLWQVFVSKYVQKDFKNYALVPANISFEHLSNVYNKFRKFVNSSGLVTSIKLDIILILLLSQELIIHSKNYKEEWGEPINNKISGFQFAYYKSLGQQPAVTNIGFLGLPDFIVFNSEDEGNKWLDLLDEHIEIIKPIKEKYSSNIQMLQDYRQFISASDFMAFIEFQFHYSTYFINSLLQKNYFVKAFSIQHMEVLMGTNKTYMNIIENKGFQAIASAIRNSTIVPVIHKENKDAIFGLSQKFKIASKDRDTFTSEVSKFIQLYNERIMLKDYNKKWHPKYITTEELSDFYTLLDDNNYSVKLIAGMLIAFGFARDPKKSEETETAETDN